MKKSLIMIFMAFFMVSLSGCNVFGSKPSTVVPTSYDTERAKTKLKTFDELVAIGESTYIGEMTYYLGFIENAFIDTFGVNAYKSSDNMTEFEMTFEKVSESSVTNGLVKHYQKSTTDGFELEYRPTVEVSVAKAVTVGGSTWGAQFSHQRTDHYATTTLYEQTERETDTSSATIKIDVKNDPVGTNYVWSYWADIHYFQTYRYNTKTNSVEPSYIFYKIFERNDSYRIIRANTDNDYPISVLPKYITSPLSISTIQSEIKTLKTLKETFKTTHGNSFREADLRSGNYTAYKKLDTLELILKDENKLDVFNYSAMRMLGYKNIHIKLKYDIDVNGKVQIQHKIVNKTTGEQFSELQPYVSTNHYGGPLEFIFVVPIDNLLGSGSTNWIVEIRSKKQDWLGIGDFTINGNREYSFWFS